MALLKSIKLFFLKRDRNADDVSGFSAKRMGVSMAATWSWGAAIAVGIAIMQTKGMFPFLVWTAGNIMSIPFFGLLYTKVRGVRKWKKWTPFLFLWGFIGVFAIVMNLNALKAALGGGTDIVGYQFVSEPYLTPLVLLVGLLIAWFIHKKGLRGSVLTDVGQFTLQFIGVLGIILMGILTGAEAEINWMLPAAQSWIIPAFLGIITGATASGMQWQRLESAAEDKKFMSTIWAGLYFGIFMVLVGFAGYVFDGSLAVSIPFLICVLAVATSTTDSGASSLHFVSNELFHKVGLGTIVALIAVIVFPMVSDWGLTKIWGFYAGVRWKVVAFLLVVTVFRNLVTSKKVIRFFKRTKLLLD